MLPFAALPGDGITFYLLATVCIVEITYPNNSISVLSIPLWDLELNLL